MERLEELDTKFISKVINVAQKQDCSYKDFLSITLIVQLVRCILISNGFDVFCIFNAPNELKDYVETYRKKVHDVMFTDQYDNISHAYSYNLICRREDSETFILSFTDPDFNPLIISYSNKDNIRCYLIGIYIDGIDLCDCREHKRDIAKLIRNNLHNIKSLVNKIVINLSLLDRCLYCIKSNKSMFPYKIIKNLNRDLRPKLIDTYPSLWQKIFTYLNRPIPIFCVIVLCAFLCTFLYNYLN